MRIEVTVKPGAKKQEIQALGDNKFKVFVKAKPQKGEANEAVREALASYFQLSKSSVNFVHGLKSKTKLLEIDYGL